MYYSIGMTEKAHIAENEEDFKFLCGIEIPLLAISKIAMVDFVEICEDDHNLLMGPAANAGRACKRCIASYRKRHGVGERAVNELGG